MFCWNSSTNESKNRYVVHVQLPCSIATGIHQDMDWGPGVSSVSFATRCPLLGTTRCSFYGLGRWETADHPLHTDLYFDWPTGCTPQEILVLFHPTSCLCSCNVSHTPLPMIAIQKCCFSCLNVRWHGGGSLRSVTAPSPFNCTHLAREWAMVSGSVQTWKPDDWDKACHQNHSC